MHLSDVDGCGCDGLSGIPTHELSGMGLTPLPTPSSETIWQQAARQIEEWFRRSPSSASPTPIYTPPQFPSQYPTGYGTEYTEPATDWTPWIIGGIALLVLTSGRRRR